MIGWRAGRQMAHGGRHQITSPGVFNRQSQSKLNGQIADKFRSGEPTKFRNLEIYRFHATSVKSPQHGLNVGYDFIENHWQRGALPDIETLLQRSAGFFEDEPVESIEKPGCNHRILEFPSTVCVSDDEIFVCGCLHHQSGALGVLVGVSADFELKAMDPFVLSIHDILTHAVRRTERDRYIERK